MNEPFRTHLKSSTDLKTSYAAIRAGFVALALEKNRRATPFIEEARALKVAAAAAYIAAVEGLELAEHWLIRRKAYPNAAASGLSVFEYNDPGQREGISKAREDFATLTSLLFDGLTNAGERPKITAGGF